MFGFIKKMFIELLTNIVNASNKQSAMHDLVDLVNLHPNQYG